MGIELPTIAIRVKIPSYLYVQISVKIVEAISVAVVYLSFTEQTILFQPIFMDPFPQRKKRIFIYSLQYF